MNMLSLVLVASMGYCGVLCLLPGLVPSASDETTPAVPPFRVSDEVSAGDAMPSFRVSDEVPAGDAEMDFIQLANKNGYPAEEHTVVTDGYYLKIFRITGSGKCNSTKRCPPVLLGHGLADSAISWLLAGPGAALGYGLADACYDVWCASHRGSYYGRSHSTLDPDHDARFWNYALNEFARDLEAIIDYVLEYTECDNLIYVGHSQGTTDFLVMAVL